MPSIHGEIDIPPHGHAEIVLWTEPADDIVLLGAMQMDAQLQAAKLKTLPLAGDGYHGELLVIRGAAERMRRRCDRLIAQSEEAFEKAHQAATQQPPARRKAAK
jgi:hypothetical protein